MGIELTQWCSDMILVSRGGPGTKMRHVPTVSKQTGPTVFPLKSEPFIP